MKICIFNSTQNGSTGQIVRDMANGLTERGHEVFCFFGRKTQEWPEVKTFFSVPNMAVQYVTKAHCRAFGKDGFVNNYGTSRFIKVLKKIKPDLVHFNNMHGEWINIRLLMEFLAGQKTSLFWTLHDEWIETGRCGYTVFVGCSKYKTGCGRCPFRRNYPKTYIFDRSAYYWSLKRKLLTNTEPVLLSPSKWLLQQMHNGGLTTFREYVVGNPLNDSIFKVSSQKENFFDTDKPVVGFCSFVWSKSKGLYHAQKLANRLIKEGFLVVFVGLAPEDDRLPKGAVGIARTPNKQTLASIYSSMDCFVNPTLQDNFPMVNLEAISCGTPVVVFKTGGAYEAIIEGLNGYVVEQGNDERLYEAVKKVLDAPLNRISVSDTVHKFYYEKYIDRLISIYQGDKSLKK